jgi:hypothetical protein
MDDQSRKTELKKMVSPESFIRTFPMPVRVAGSESPIEYQIVPAAVTASLKATPPKRWRIILEPVERPSEQLALELVGDVSIGSCSDEDTPVDVNLAVWNGTERGVSHRHAMLRPSQSKLFLLDLGSTNKTHYNGALLTADRVQVVQQGDLITLGRLHLRVKSLAQIEISA